MFEKFTKPARSVVEGAVGIAIDSRATHVRPEHLFVALLGEADSLAVRVLSDQGAPADRALEELEGRRNRYLDGQGDEDAEALATSASTSRRSCAGWATTPVTASVGAASAGGRASRGTRRRRSSCRCARQSACDTTTSGPST